MNQKRSMTEASRKSTAEAQYITASTTSLDAPIGEISADVIYMIPRLQPLMFAPRLPHLNTPPERRYRDDLLLAGVDGNLLRCLQFLTSLIAFSSSSEMIGG